MVLPVACWDTSSWDVCGTCSVDSFHKNQLEWCQTITTVLLYWAMECVCLNHCNMVSNMSVMEMDRQKLISGVATFSKAVLPKMQFSVMLHGVLR